MSTQLFFFAVDVIGFFSVLLFGLRVLVTSPKQLNARLVALICFNSACATVLARQDYAFWIPDAYQLHVGLLRVVLHIARNLTSGVFMMLCHSLFQDESRMPRLLVAAFALQILMEFAGALRSTNGPEWQYDFLQTVPALLQLFFVGCALYWMLRGWRTDLVEARRQLRGSANAQLVFDISVTLQLAVVGVAVSSLIGFIGGLFPAVRAARLPIAAALRRIGSAVWGPLVDRYRGAPRGTATIVGQSKPLLILRECADGDEVAVRIPD